MAIEIKIIKRKNPRQSLELLSQKEIIKRINKSTRRSYKYFDLLSWKCADSRGNY